MSTSLIPLGPQPIYPSRTQARTRTLQSPLFRRTHFTHPHPKPHFRGPLVVAKFGFLNSGQLPDPGAVEGTIKELFGRAEGLLYTIADATIANADAVTSSPAAATKQDGDWLSGITSYMETVLKVLNDGLSAVHMPYSYGFAIILLTVLVKAVTFPLSKKQVESTMAMRSLQPQIKAIQKRYAGDQERIQAETGRLYKLAGINPLAGCLPTLVTIPVWIGLYRALSNVANEGLLTEGFFWIPSLAGPTTVAARQNGSGISWLFPFVDGHPPLGWSDTAAYLVLPLLLVASQYISIRIMQSSQSDDPNQKTSQALTNFLPLMIGYFALSVPSGLSLYWLTNNILSTAQQVWLQKMGGAKNPIGQVNEENLKENNLLGQVEIFKKELQPEEYVREAKSSQAEIKSTQTQEISPSTGLRPGERFKKLKEEEARRKRQMEAAKMQTEEGASDTVLISKNGHEKQDSVVGPPNGTITGSVDSKEHDNKSDSTSKNGRPTNEREQPDEEDVEKLQKEVVEALNRLSSMDQSSRDETS